MIDALSPMHRCAICRRTVKRHKLEVDHVDGCAWDKRKVSAWIRVARYWREFLDGVRLRAACRSCNARYRPDSRWQYSRSNRYNGWIQVSL